MHGKPHKIGSISARALNVNVQNPALLRALQLQRPIEEARQRVLHCEQQYHIAADQAAEEFENSRNVCNTSTHGSRLKWNPKAVRSSPMCGSFQQLQLPRPQLPQPTQEYQMLEHPMDVKQPMQPHHGRPEILHPQVAEYYPVHNPEQRSHMQGHLQHRDQQQVRYCLLGPGDLAAAFAKLLKQRTAAVIAKQLLVSTSTSTTIVLPSAADAATLQDEQYWQQLLVNTQQVLLQLQPHQASLIVYTTAKLNRPMDTALLRSILQQQVHQHHLQVLPAAGLTNMLWSLAITGSHPGAEWMSCFYSACSSRGLASLNRHQLSNILWSLGKLSDRPPAEWLQELLAVLRPNLQSLAPTELTNVLWGLAQLGYRPGKGWAKDWFAANMKLLHNCTADHLACIAASLGLLRLDPRSGHWLRSYRNAVLQLLPSMRAAHVAAIMCGLAKRLSSQPPHWVGLLVARQLQILQALQQQRQGQHGASAAAAAATTSTSSGIKPGDLAATVWALPRLLYPTASAWKSQPSNAAQLAALISASLPLLPVCSSAELIQLAVGLAGVRCYPGAHWLKVHENAIAVHYAHMSELNKARLRTAVKVLWSDG